MSEITSPQAFGDSQGFCLRMPTYIEPTEVVEAGRIDYERVLFPMAYRITQPARIQIAEVLRKLPTIGVDDPMRTTRRFMQHDDHARSLHDLRQTSKIQEWHAHRQTAGKRAVFSEILDSLLAQLLGPRLNLFGLQVLRDVVVVSVFAGASRTPNTGQVRLAVCSARGGRRKIRFAVRQAGDSRCWIVDPLLCGRRRGQRAHE